MVLSEGESKTRSDHAENLHSVGHAFDALYAYLQAAGFRGWEFDDLLASKSVSAVTGNSLLAKRVAIQIGERLALNIRPMLRVPKLESTKARAFIVKGLLCRHEADGRPAWLAI